jgi:cytochrome c-type biogenesis protein CcmF
MIPEIGHAALWLAAALSIMGALVPALGLARGREQWTAFAAPAAVAQGVLTLLAFIALVWCFVVSDFSVRLVNDNSHTFKPMLYKVTGTWANHEGSMLLWVTVLSLAGAAVAALGKPLGGRFRARVLSVQALIGSGFFAFLLLASNPFERIALAPVEGRGLNPLLQDPGLAFHPPTLYVGYVGLSVAFAFAVAALLERRVTPQWALQVRPWVLAAWATLTAGIALGSWWAYYELGWGGFWFWDPVENASLMPWLAATALLHSVSVLATRDALRNWTILLAVVAFSLSMVGTFIVRSGVITSVHSFAVDPTRGLFLLVLLGLYVGGALLLYASRASTVEVGEGFAPVSRESGLVANNLLLSAALGVVFVGTLYPLALEGVTGERISVGAPYFNATFAPIAILLIALMPVGPLLDWKRANQGKLLPRLVVPAIAAAAAAVAALALFDSRSAMALIGFALSAWAAAGTLMTVARRKWRRMPASTWGMTLAHLGVALSLFGVTASTSLHREALVAMRVGDTLKVAGFDARLEAVDPTAGPNYTAIEGRLAVTRGGAPVVTLVPQSRTYTSPAMETTEAGIATLLAGDLYAVLGKPDGTGRWQVRFYWQPMVWAIWAGGLLMAAGGLVSIGGRRRARAAAALEATLAAAVPA